MGSGSYKTRVLVIRKKALRESDLILDALQEDGSLVSFVAKGARKPTNPFASRLELFSVADVCMARGRNLDIVKEARLVDSNERLRTDIDASAVASPIAEALRRCAQKDLEVPHLFEMSRSALLHLDSCERQCMPAITAAALLKLLAFLGMRPSFNRCTVCGTPIDLNAVPSVRFSYESGGAVCFSCVRTLQTISLPSSTCAWCNALMMMTFDTIVHEQIDTNTGFAVLDICRHWFREQLNMKLVSLDCLASWGLF
ncbi:MAG: DNA repair protein RecO [Eggerthellaceae bacterium]|nr:DNA repair protein RecO [Eggerthellaceae bacterium]MCH4221126.1 DNA repair protein RecO [Eggerthellaceae bacterium]